MHPTPFQPGVYRLSHSITNPHGDKKSSDNPWRMLQIGEGRYVRLTLDKAEVPLAVEAIDKEALALCACTWKPKSTYPERLVLGCVVNGKWRPSANPLAGLVLGALVEVNEEDLTGAEFLSDLAITIDSSIDASWLVEAVLTHGADVLVSSIDATGKIEIGKETLSMRRLARRCAELEHKADERRYEEAEAQRVREAAEAERRRKATLERRVAAWKSTEWEQTTHAGWLERYNGAWQPFEVPAAELGELAKEGSAVTVWLMDEHPVGMMHVRDAVKVYFLPKKAKRSRKAR